MKRVILILILLGLSNSVHAELHADSIFVPTGTWIFSQFDCGCPPCDASCPYPTPVDARLFLITDPPLGWALITDWGGQALGDVPIDSVLVAPADGYDTGIAANNSEEITVGHIYAIRTMDGGHALIQPLSLTLDGMTFVYKYQDDGSGSFQERVPVSPATWGRIKAFYGR